MKAGWQLKPFEECIEKVVYTTKVQRKDFLDDGAYPIVSQEDAFINGYWDNEADLFKVTTPIVIFGDHTKVLKYVDFDFVLGADGVKLLQSREFLSPKYFFYQLQAANLVSLGYARHYKLLKELKIVYPARSEQQRIVGILDEALAGIATAKANAEKNLRNARDLSDALIQSLFPHDSNAPAEHTLEELSESIVDCEHKTAPTQDSGIPSIRTPNIGRGKLLLEGVYRVSDSTYKEWTRRAEPRPGDLILAREAPAGNVAVIPEGMKVCLGQRTVLIRPKKNAFDSTYLAYLLLQKNSQRRLLAHSRGATVQHINVKDIRAFRLADVPSLDEQKAVVVQVEDLLAKEAHLVSLYHRKFTALDALKQSLLHQAFSGQL
ncbi:restriction endonuclease subunit S [Stenotrophomonas sp. YIM B06876]|uniref:restriction endonuclease subunit S n=1 Tax=Stenotrophomonas sp. YIM B06876 TaxID=3060211 RepID=UPI002738E62F|nr:restriction endonuclease subunit S [Stenotrophomonas sp. YIM B06876]